MILRNPQDAIGYEIRWCRWPDERTFKVEGFVFGRKKMTGVFRDEKGVTSQRTYNMVKGITTGEVIDEHWYILNYVDYRLEDELFEL